MSVNPVVSQVKDMVRQPHAWPGGYTKVATMADGEAMCHACVKANYRQVSNDTRHAGCWAVAGVDAHWEGEPLVCCNCNASIESEYGVPE